MSPVLESLAVSWSEQARSLLSYLLSHAHAGTCRASGVAQGVHAASQDVRFVSVERCAHALAGMRTCGREQHPVSRRAVEEPLGIMRGRHAFHKLAGCGPAGARRTLRTTARAPRQRTTWLGCAAAPTPRARRAASRIGRSFGSCGRRERRGGSRRPSSLAAGARTASRVTTSRRPCFLA